ncbi:MAG: starch-binding protein, partial [Bacteroidaceae bacterium]|nr:starch-binding protein [Bacteroidaceae bacterium]
MKKITTFLLALLLVIPAMAHNLAASSKMYFEKPSTWSAAQFMIGHSGWSEGYPMSNISNTNLYYISMVKWDGYTQWIVFDQSSKWGGEGNSITHRANYMGNNKTTIGTSALGTCNLINTNGTFTALSSYSSLNHTQTIAIEGEGTTTISTYKLNGDNTSTTSTGTTSADAAYTATVKCTATAADGYQFVGWYDGSTLLSTNATYSYTAANATKTITARFEQLAAETPVISNFAASATNVEAGDVVTFSCDVENGDVANVVYLVNGEAIVGNEWTPTEAGEYTISATLDGALTQTLTVTVYVKPAINAGEKAVFFDNTNSQWEKVCAYVWNGTGNKVAWPGEECQYLGNNMWKYTCSDFEPNLLIFNNNNNGSQTVDFDWVNGGVYSTASKTPSQVILPEGLNIQLTIPTTA